MGTNPPKTAPKRVGQQEHLDHRVNQLGAFFEEKLTAAKNELIEVVKTATKAPDRYTDRFLHWVAAKPASWLFWVVLGFTHILAASIWHAIQTSN